MVTGLPSTSAVVTALPRVLATTRVLPEEEGVGFLQINFDAELIPLLFSLTFRLNLRYSHDMKKTLIETNPHLKDPAKRTQALARNVVSSSAIEGIRVARNANSGRFVSTDKKSAIPDKSPKTSR